MDRTDDTTRSNDLLHEIDMYRYERYNSTYHEVNSAVLIGIEVSYPPNPYKDYLILGLVCLIVLKYNLDKKIIEVLEKWLK